MGQPHDSPPGAGPRGRGNRGWGHAGRGQQADSDVAPPQMVRDGIGGRFERALMKPLSGLFADGCRGSGRSQVAKPPCQPRHCLGRRRWHSNREEATVVERRHGCRRGKVFEGCETPPSRVEARRERACTAISNTRRLGLAGHGRSEQRREPRIRDRAAIRPGAGEGASR
jgi:hypothetical protein